MDKEQAKDLIKIGEESNVTLVNPKSGTRLTFLRANMKDVEEIESLSDKELITQFKDYDSMIEQGCFSICDLQLHSLMGIEIESRRLEDEISIHD